MKSTPDRVIAGTCDFQSVAAAIYCRLQKRLGNGTCERIFLIIRRKNVESVIRSAPAFSEIDNWQLQI